MKVVQGVNVFYFNGLNALHDFSEFINQNFFHGLDDYNVLSGFDGRFALG